MCSKIFTYEHFNSTPKLVVKRKKIEELFQTMNTFLTVHRYFGMRSSYLYAPARRRRGDGTRRGGGGEKQAEGDRKGGASEAVVARDATEAKSAASAIKSVEASEVTEARELREGADASWAVEARGPQI